MRKYRTAVLTGIAALAITGAGLAAGRDIHMMKVNLPDGSVARIEYKGDVAPNISIAPAFPTTPVGFVAPFDASPFGLFDRIAAMMDRQTEAMIHEVGALPAAPLSADGKLDLAALGKLPPGTVHYRFVSTSNGSGTCDRSIEVTSLGAGEAPRVVSSSSGDCKPADGTPTPARLDPPLHPVLPGLSRSKATATADHLRAGTTV